MRAVWILTIVVLLVASGTVAAENSLASAPAKAPTPLQLFLQHIKHVVVVVMENHAFDSEFGTYCQVVSAYCPTTVAGIPPGTCVPLYPNNTTNKACVKPYPFTAQNDSPGQQMLHTRNSSVEAWNGGLMNNFYLAEESGSTPFGYYDGNTTPLLWDFAEEYGLADNYFSSYLTYSLSTHWSYVAGGNGPPITERYGLGDSTGGYSPAGVRATYLKQAQNTTSVEDLLNRTHTSWKYYEYPLTNWTKESNTSQIGGPSTNNAFNYWNPQAAKKESYGPNLTTHFVVNQQFFAHAKAGTLPQLSWVIPYFRYSQHPAANITLGDGWLASLVDAVESGPDWNSTAIFLTYDEYGGFYDNVPPPVVNGTQLGFRIPLIVISPYTAPGTVVSSLLDPWSVLQAFEQVGHLGCMSDLDCFAPSVLPFFNFTMGPRAPMLFPTNDSQASYPMALQSDSGHPTMVSNWQVPSYILDGTGENSGFED